jgi:hypothetical protein
LRSSSPERLPDRRDQFADVLLEHLRAAHHGTQQRWRSEWSVRSIGIAKRFLDEASPI